MIPAYNEANRLPATIERIIAYSTESFARIAEVIIVDDGSRDLTNSVARSYSHRSALVRVVGYTENSGKGYAIRRGVMEASGDLVLITDADLSTPIEELPKLHSRVEAGDDVAIGSRALDRTTVKVSQGRLRQGMGITFNRIMRMISGIPFHDTQCGFKLLRRSAAREIFQKATVDRFAWDVEMLLLASRCGYKVSEVPVLWFNSDDSRVHIVRDSSRMLWDVVRIVRRVGRWEKPREDGRDER